MPTLDTIPKTLKPYLFHGIDLVGTEGQANAECPFCGRADKFTVNVDTGVFRCFVCATGNEKGGGNAKILLRLIHKHSMEQTKAEDYESLAHNRKLLNHETLVKWGACKSFITGEWLIPGYSTEGKITQLYKYAKNKDGKRILFATPELHHGLFGVPLFDRKKSVVYLSEGCWDGMALWEALGMAKEDGEGLTLTSNPIRSLRSGANVLAIPGCGSVGKPLEYWSTLFTDKRVVLLFDSDHPKELEGRTVEPAGYAAKRRAVDIFTKVSDPPKEVYHVYWGEGGYDPDKPSGYDIRDFLSED